MDHTAYNRDSAGWMSYVGPIAITTEGTHSLQYQSIDKAGNSESPQSLAVKIDKTSPEAFVQFDPATKDLLVYGRDALSGVPSTALVPTITPAVRDDASNDDDWRLQPELLPLAAQIKSEDPSTTRLEQRTYQIADAAGNTETLVMKVRRGSHSIVGQVLSIQYNGGTVTTLARNRFVAAWLAKADGSLAALAQALTTQGPPNSAVFAGYLGAQNQTLIVNPNAPRGQRLVFKPGLVLLRDATKTGKLVFEY